jgi:hypothetical protein
MTEFTLQEAVSLIYRIAVLKTSLGEGKKPPGITDMGHICGVLTLNEQIEVVIKFHDALRQFNKQEFQDQVSLMD